ncbi:MAG: glycosyltransferase [Acidobacteria bacterium]|nr:glycosyltransferase [Acidobacteriota bacterium]
MTSMRVARLLLASASPFDTKCFRFDRYPSSDGTERAWSLTGAPDTGTEMRSEGDLARELRNFTPDILHVYGFGAVPHRLIRAAGSPWLADRRLSPSRPLLGRRPPAQARALIDEIAEPVGEEYFVPPRPRSTGANPRVGAYIQSARTASTRDLVDARIRRFRDDVRWSLFDTPPSVSQMRELDLWIDLAGDENELDGQLCEALALGLPVVAARTAANRLRTDDGRAAALCPQGDHNELAHAIVTMLFKPERAEPILAAATSRREMFRPERRREALAAAYREVCK